MPSLPFHPIIRKWFLDNYLQPTDIQSKSWPAIASGQHVLITAPTGSGKTLTAFLWAINQLMTGQWKDQQTSVLYISPLKALNNDIRRNLDQPLLEIQEAFKAADERFPSIRVFTRSGDTAQVDRRRMLRHPPEILITTPESLNLLLSSKSGREILTTLTTVILDEIHAVVGEKRGVHLITAVDRLVKLSGEFQRIALSATIKPLEAVADFIGGFRIVGSARHPEFKARSVSILQSDLKKKYQINVRFPDHEIRNDSEDPVWNLLAEEFKEIIQKNRSTLLFANSRKLSEKLTYKINTNSNQVIAYAHHGSLSKEIRENVEQKLKNGDLKAIVATSSLEMGIDVGDLDEVVLIQSPPSVSAAIQRIGRAGHRVGEVSRGTVFPSHAQDFLHAAVLVEAIDHQDIEAINPIQCPLDVLAQVLTSMVCAEPWDIDELYGWLRTSYPYRQLSREQYDLVLNMLAGRYADSRIRELKPRISIDRLDNTVAGKKGALMAVFMSGGTIPDRGYFQLRHQKTGARIGELDEEYVWEARIGQIATIGTQNWKIQRFTHNDVFATPAGNPIMNAPFWKGEEYQRDFHFSQRISTFLEKADEHLSDPDFRKELKSRYHMNPAAIRQLMDFLNKQKEDTASELPHRHHLLMEYVRSGPDGAPGSQLVIHTLWGGQVNRPFAMALDAAWENQFGERLEIFPGNDSVALQLAHPMKPEDLLTLVNSDTVENLLKQRLEGSGFFGARFRECAGRALLITKNKINQRMPLWMTRLRSQKLMESILKYDDFPILLETWRTCLQDEFDLDHLKQMLTELETGAISWTVANTSRPSPFAAGLTWNQVDKYMYQVDQPASTPSSLRNDLLRDVVFNADLRPAIPGEIITRFEEKRQRLATGYAPQSDRELVDWLKERILIPQPEWDLLLSAMERDTPRADEIMELASPKLLSIKPSPLHQPLIGALEFLPQILNGLFAQHPDISLTLLNGNLVNTPPDVDLDEEQGTSLLSEWMQFYGPKSREFIESTLGLKQTMLDGMLEGLVQSQSLIAGELLLESGTSQFCDSENFEMLLRLNRAASKPVFQALPTNDLPFFVAHFQGLTKPGHEVDDLFQKLEQLSCLTQPAEAWESDIFPARLSNYRSSLLDTIMQEGELNWMGRGKQKVAFCFQSDLDLMTLSQPASLSDDLNDSDSNQSALNCMLSDRQGRYSFTALQQITNLHPGELSNSIWEEVWKGALTNDSFASLRKGIEQKFQFKSSTTSKPDQRRRGRRSMGRSGFIKWKGMIPYAGNWFLLPDSTAPEDLLEKEELNKDRVRVLMDRYGILFRELVSRELPEFSWRSLFRSLRLMELSGEVLAGYFFENIPGPQFISHQAFRTLQSNLPRETIYWLNATDPASLCGLPIDDLKAYLPKRLSGTHLVFKGAELVLISERNGKALTIQAEPDDQRIQEYLVPVKHLLYRQFMPLKQVIIETINQINAAQSPFADALKTSFEVLTEHRKLTLYRKL